MPGEIAVVKPRKQWAYAGYPYLSGEIASSHLDIDALGLVPLKLEDQGLWTPEQHYWGEATSQLRSGPNPSSPAVQDSRSRWSRSCRAETRRTSIPIRSASPMT